MTMAFESFSGWDCNIFCRKSMVTSPEQWCRLVSWPAPPLFWAINHTFYIKILQSHPEKDSKAMVIWSTSPWSLMKAGMYKCRPCRLQTMQTEDFLKYIYIIFIYLFLFIITFSPNFSLLTLNSQSYYL